MQPILGDVEVGEIAGLRGEAWHLACWQRSFLKSILVSEIGGHFCVIGHGDRAVKGTCGVSAPASRPRRLVWPVHIVALSAGTAIVPWLLIMLARGRKPA